MKRPSADESVERVAEWFRQQKDLKNRTSQLLRDAIDAVFDGAHTGYFQMSDLDRVERAYLGFKVEHYFRHEFELPKTKRLDTEIAGVPVDIKWTSGKTWMIPKEALGQVCVLLQADEESSTYSFGVVRISDEILTPVPNRDGKRSISAEGRKQVCWLAKERKMPANFIFSLRDEVRSKILAPRSGQQRVNELFRRVRRKLISRNAVETVAQQIDPAKRVRDARKALAPEGIKIDYCKAARSWKSVPAKSDSAPQPDECSPEASD